jgi:membrane protease YdiL (CAAX protease family)
VGLVLVSVAFGAGHILQGWDAAIVTGLLGAAWGVLYLLRRSAVAPIVSHAGYNAAQVLQAVAVQSLRA